MINYQEKLKKYLEITIKEQASDLHLSVGHPPVLRIAGTLLPLVKERELLPEDCQELAFCLMDETQAPSRKEIYFFEPERSSRRN